MAECLADLDATVKWAAAMVPLLHGMDETCDDSAIVGSEQQLELKQRRKANWLAPEIAVGFDMKDSTGESIFQEVLIAANSAGVVHPVTAEGSLYTLL